jgi:hypothetical protein
MSKASANPAAKMDLPRRNDAVKGFLERHSLKEDVYPIAALIEPAIYWSAATLLLLQTGFAGASQTLLNDPTSGLLLNMLNRNFEAVDGAVTAFLIDCGPTSELSSRAAIELSVSILYILMGDRRVRLLAYFDAYISGVRAQIKRWRDTITKLPAEALEAHNSSTSQREQANEMLAELVGQIRAQFGVDQRLGWPNVSDRFEAIGWAAHYRTVYARLSSQTHSDAEDTLRYFAGVTSGSQALIDEMGMETVHFTMIMILFAVSDFVKASIVFAAIHDWSECVATLYAATSELDTCLLEISTKIGGRGTPVAIVAGQMPPVHQ